MGSVLARAGERSRAGFLRRITPALSGVLEPGESLVAWGYAMQRPSRGTTFVMGGLSGLAVKHYVVAATDRRLIVMRMVNVGTTAEVDTSCALGSVTLSGVRKTFLDVQMDLDACGAEAQARASG